MRIIKGQASMDTIQRQREFEKKNSYGWEEDYSNYVKDWFELPQRRYVRDYPPQVDIELSSICNLRCPMCFTLNDEFKKVKGVFMNFGLFKKIIDEIAEKVYKIHLSFRGEPTLNPEFIECVRYAKSKGIGEVTTVTNGTALNLDFFIKAADAGMDRFTVSIDGLDNQYDRIRHPLKFHDIVNKLKLIKDYKNINGLIKPVIKVQGVWPAIKPSPEEFYHTFLPLSDLIAFNPLMDWRHNDTDIEYEDNFCCSTLYQRLVVGADGKVVMCINDELGDYILGDVNVQSIHDIWNGEKMNAIRRNHQEGTWQECAPCKKCALPRKTVFNESFKVDGRTIWVENYVNRKQIIGE